MYDKRLLNMLRELRSHSLEAWRAAERDMIRIGERDNSPAVWDDAISRYGKFFDLYKRIGQKLNEME